MVIINYSILKNMENNFLPNEYKIPDNKGYMKFKDGENTFRALSSVITGYEYWNTNNKPVRSKDALRNIPEDIRIDASGNPTKVRHFWAFVVWNYDSESIQILEITQSTIQAAIKAMVDNKKWGSPLNYDITVTRTGEGFDTEYTVMPNPVSELSPEVKELYNSRVISLGALYEGKNPFEVSE